jgi:hypothetical protein
MPLMKFHVFKGRTTEEINLLLDTAHTAMVRSFNVPERDRYQILTEHEASHFRALDTGLNIPRTDKFVLLEVASRPETRMRNSTSTIPFVRVLQRYAVWHLPM